MAVEATGEEDIARQRAQPRHGRLQPRQRIARFEQIVRIAGRHGHVVDRDVEGGGPTRRELGAVAQQVGRDT